MSGEEIEKTPDAAGRPVTPPVDQHDTDAPLVQAKTKTAEPNPPAASGTPAAGSPPDGSAPEIDVASHSRIETGTSPSTVPLAALTEPRSPAHPSISDSQGEAEIDRLLAQANAQPTNFAAAEAALRKIDQSENDALRTPPSKDAALGEDAPLAPLDHASRELDVPLAGGGPDEELTADGQDVALPPSDAPVTDEPALAAETAPLTLGQEELEALLSPHPLARAESPASPPVAQPEVEDPVERAERENAQAGVGRENLAAAVPDPEAGEQPLEQDLIDSLLAQAAQAASAAPRGTGKPQRQEGELKDREDDAVALSDDDFADMGITMPAPQVSLVSEPADEPVTRSEDASPVVQRRLRRQSKVSAKFVAALAASFLVGAATFAYLWSHRAQPAEPSTAATANETPDLRGAIALARELMGRGEYVDAMRKLGAAIRGAASGPVLDEARFLHVEAGYRSLPPAPKPVDVETVLKNIEDVIALAPNYPRNPEALAWKAELYERTGSLTLARDTYERILSTYPHAPGADNTLLQEARIAFQLSYFEDAERALTRIVDEFPQSTHKSEAQMLLAQCYEATGRAPDAVTMYTAVAAERTESRVGADAALALARMATASGDGAGAIRALESRLQTATTADGNDAVYVELAKAYRAAGKPADAVRVAREFLNFSPDSARIPEAVVQLTKALEENGEPHQALELAQQAADRFDKNADVAKNRAVMLSNAGDTRAAAEALEKADELGANDPQILLDAGKKFMEVEESEKATKLLQRVIEKYPDSAQAVDAGVELGKQEFKNGKIGQAIDRLAALAAAPNASTRQLEVQAALGDIYSGLGLTKRATAAYERVATLATDSATLARAATALMNNGELGAALPVIRKVDLARLTSKAGFEFLMAQGRAMLDVEPEAALHKMQQAFEQYPVERRPQDFEYLVRACLQTGKTAHARILMGDFDGYVQRHPEARNRLQQTASLWGDALFQAGDYRGALDAYALAIPGQASQTPATSDAQQSAEPPPPSRVETWARFQRASAMLKLDDFANSLPILDALATSDTPYAEDARIKAEYARLEQRMRGGPAILGEGG